MRVLLFLGLAMCLFGLLAQAQQKDDAEFQRHLRQAVDERVHIEGGVRSRDEIADYLAAKGFFQGFAKGINDPENGIRDKMGLVPAEQYAQEAMRFFSTRLKEPQHYYHHRVFFAQIALVATAYYSKNRDFEKASAIFNDGYRVAMSLTDDNEVKSVYVQQKQATSGVR